MAKKEKEDLSGVRLKFAPHVNRHHRIELYTTEQILMGRMLQQNQQIIKQNRELIKLAKEISGKLSAGKLAEKKPEKTVKTAESKEKRTGKPRGKARKLHKGETVEPFKRDGTS